MSLSQRNMKPTKPKTPRRVEVVASKPLTGQKPIPNLAGKRFDVVFFDPDYKTVSIIAPDFDGKTILNPGEFKFVKS